MIFLSSLPSLTHTSSFSSLCIYWHNWSSLCHFWSGNFEQAISSLCLNGFMISHQWLKYPRRGGGSLKCINNFKTPLRGSQLRRFLESPTNSGPTVLKRWTCPFLIIFIQKSFMHKFNHQLVQHIFGMFHSQWRTKHNELILIKFVFLSNHLARVAMPV